MIKKVIVIAKYLDFANIFLKKLAAKLPKYLNINKYAINIKIDKQLSYILI